MVFGEGRVDASQICAIVGELATFNTDALSPKKMHAKRAK
jgi:hypothetical protein